MPKDYKELYEERAAIIEFEGGFSKQEAEEKSLEEITMIWLDDEKLSLSNASTYSKIIKFKRHLQNMIEVIYCCGCKKEIEARLTSGAEVYPSREDLAQLPFWKCDNCKNFVGCNHKTKNPTRPLGCIPTKEISNARKYLHALIDPLWKNHAEPFRARGWIYRWLAQKIGKTEYHTAEIRSVEEAREVYKICLTIKTAEDCKNV